MTEKRTVLVADDEDQLLRLIVRLVEKDGGRALAAATANEARDLFAEYRETIDAVLLDVSMQEGDGAQKLLPEFRAARPDLNVIVTSGDALPTALADDLEEAGGHFLRKPFAPRALSRLLDEVMAGEQASSGSEPA